MSTGKISRNEGFERISTFSNDFTSFYVTTPIYYVNDAPHIGHAYTTVLADVLARYHRLFEEETFFLTGTDEHGQKVQNSARARGLTPKEHCDEYVERFKSIWQELGIEYDFFVRTTMDFHKKVVQDCLQELYEKGEIYAGDYEGWYSESEEMFYTEDELVDGKSPFGKEVSKIKERNYFFRMEKYREPLLKHIDENPDFILPRGRKNEVLGSLRKPLNDLCISRPKSRLTWGVELPFDRDFVTYVWFDALLNYTSATGFKDPDQKRREQFAELWPSVVHLIGKDILFTHAVYWPCMLLSLGLSLPKHIFAHGWWLTEDDKKMSKSEGPVITPLEMKDVVGVASLRYFLIRAMSPAQDGHFSKELLVSRINSELSNNLGNLLSRSLGLIAKHFDGSLPKPSPKLEMTSALSEKALACASEVEQLVRSFQPNRAVERVLDFLSETNRYLDELAPWKELKSGDKALAAEALYSAVESLRIVGILLHPVMPDKMKELLQRLGWQAEPKYSDACKWALLPEGSKIIKADPLFPRVE